MVRRILVEKKTGFDGEAKALLRRIREEMKIPEIENVRILNRYDIEGISGELYRKAKFSVFAEAPSDRLFEETLPEEIRAAEEEGRAAVFAVWYLPGQFDQRAESAAQCLRLIDPDADPAVRCARVFVLEGPVSRETADRIRGHLINPVDSEEAPSEKPEFLRAPFAEPGPVSRAEGFPDLDRQALNRFSAEWGLAMSPDDLAFVQEYFRKENREPTETELRVIDTYWSDHCRHTTFLTELTKVEVEEGPLAPAIREAWELYRKLREEAYGEKAGEKPVTLMDMACLGARVLRGRGLAPDVDESEEINACSIRVTAEVNGKPEDWIVMFKNETHNHPTEIEPFGGAATCLGGAIRDPLSGRVYVYQAMRVTGAADPRPFRTPLLPGKLSQTVITKGAADGYSSYGNQIGIATGMVREIYHPGYAAKRMEVGAVIGAAPADHIRRERPAPGDLVILTGGRTGRDGCGGATGSSKAHTEDSLFSCGAEVQKGNPTVERDLQRLFRRREAARLIKRCNDFGAGGVSVAVGELADSLEIYLDRVPKKYEGLNGTELAISESQERMAVVVDPRDKDAFFALAEEENLEASVVAEVTDTGRVRMHWRDQCILDLSRAFLSTNGVRQKTEVRIAGAARIPAGREKRETEDLSAPPDKSFLLELAGRLNSCSQKGLIERFDSTIGAGTLLMPLGGTYQETPPAGMAAKLPVDNGDTTTATLMTFGFDPFLSERSPFHGAVSAVVDSVTKQVAMGGSRRNVRLSFQEYFQRLERDPERWGLPAAALLGALKAQMELEIPAIGGKDSMSGSFEDLHVPPTLISFAVSTVHAGRVLSPELKEGGGTLVLLYTPRDGEGMPDFKQYRINMDAAEKAVENGTVLAASTVGPEGLFPSVTAMAAGNRLGIRLEPLTRRECSETAWGSLILQLAPGRRPDEVFAGLPVKVLGEADSRPAALPEITVGNLVLSLEEVTAAASETLESVFPTKAAGGPAAAEPGRAETEDAGETSVDRAEGTVLPAVPGAGKMPAADPEGEHFRRQDSGKKAGSAFRTPRPRVLIPVFPGTNCEVDSRRAFEAAGALVEILPIRNRTASLLTESIEALEKAIGQSQILFLPGGFSGGDEPDGSAKFIAAVFRNPRISEAADRFLKQRDSLVLGICNGFQALIKLGLLPYGEIRTIREDSPTLTFNHIGRHVSRLVRTRIISCRSPWLAAVKQGDVHTLPVSHGEGRFAAPAAALEELASRDQIAAVYEDLTGAGGERIKGNPNGSALDIEGITSPDGRILGKMAHSERIGPYLYRNVPGTFDQRLFRSGVAYFR